VIHRRISGLRLLVAISFAVSSLVVMAAPAAAETVLVACNGTCGSYELKDMGPTGPKGAVCGYEKVSFYLDFISVRPPLMHGNYQSKTKVAWRFKIQNTADNVNGTWATIFTSTYQSAKANDAIPAYAGRGFSRRWWYASEGPSGYYRVWIEMAWWHNGSVEGTARVEYDHYKWLWNGNSGHSSEFCAWVVN
jgi:hypothetical protein